MTSSFTRNCTLLSKDFRKSLQYKLKHPDSEYEGKDELDYYEDVAQFFTTADAVVTYMMTHECYTPKAVEAVASIMGMMAIAFPERYCGRSLSDRCDESVRDLDYAYRNFRYRSVEAYRNAKDPVLKEAAADELRGYMLSMEEELNDLLHTCDYLLDCACGEDDDYDCEVSNF